jgi:hypothetical protein
MSDQSQEYQGVDHRKESESLKKLHEKVDKVIICLCGDPSDKNDTGMKGEQISHGCRIKDLEDNHKKIIGFIVKVAAGVSVVVVGGLLMAKVFHL